MPTVGEFVPGFAVTTMYGISALAKTPRVIIERLHSEILRALNSSDLRGRLLEAGADPVGSTPEEYTAFIPKRDREMGEGYKDGRHQG